MEGPGKAVLPMSAKQHSEAALRRRARYEARIQAARDWLSTQVHKDLSGDDVRASVAMAKSRGRDRVRRTRDGKTKVLPFAAVAPGGEGTAGANLGPGTYAVEHYDPFARAPAFDFERVTGRPDAVGPHGERPTGLQLSDSDREGDIMILSPGDRPDAPRVKSFTFGRAHTPSGMLDDTEERIVLEPAAADVWVRPAQGVGHRYLSMQKQTGRGPLHPNASSDEDTRLVLDVKHTLVEPKAPSAVIPRARPHQGHGASDGSDGEQLVLDVQRADDATRRRVTALVDMRRVRGRDTPTKAPGSQDEGGMDLGVAYDVDPYVASNVRRPQAALRFEHQVPREASGAEDPASPPPALLLSPNVDVSKPRVGRGTLRFDVGAPRWPLPAPTHGDDGPLGSPPQGDVLVVDVGSRPGGAPRTAVNMGKAPARWAGRAADAAHLGSPEEELAPMEAAWDGADAWGGPRARTTINMARAAQRWLGDEGVVGGSPTEAHLALSVADAWAMTQPRTRGVVISAVPRDLGVPLGGVGTTGGAGDDSAPGLVLDLPRADGMTRTRTDKGAAWSKSGGAPRVGAPTGGGEEDSRAGPVLVLEPRDPGRPRTASAAVPRGARGAGAPAASHPGGGNDSDGEEVRLQNTTGTRRRVKGAGFGRLTADRPQGPGVSDVSVRVEHGPAAPPSKPARASRGGPVGANDPMRRAPPRFVDPAPSAVSATGVGPWGNGGLGPPLKAGGAARRARGGPVGADDPMRRAPPRFVDPTPSAVSQVHAGPGDGARTHAAPRRPRGGPVGAFDPMRRAGPRFVQPVASERDWEAGLDRDPGRSRR